MKFASGYNLLLECGEIVRIPPRKRHAMDIQVKELRKAVPIFTDETAAIDRAEELRTDANPEYGVVGVFPAQLK
ncbi:MAG: hypothetical protein U9Q68_01300 [Euryarchaeota archaeon]|nr:hypothetical protein [Euryarchaeota archaeon]